MTAIEQYGQDPATVTNPAYWDCECEKDYIRTLESTAEDES